MLRRALLAGMLLTFTTVASAQVPWSAAPQSVVFSNVDLANPVNLTSSLTQGLLAWYLELPHINEAGTAWRNLTRRGSDGLLTSMATPWTATSGRGRTSRPGGYGELRFDGTNDYVSAGTVGQVLTNLPAWSVAFWVLRRTGQAGDPVLLSQGRFAVTGFYIQARAADTILAIGITSSTAPPLVADTWTHLAVVKTPGSALFYFNGRNVTATNNGDNVLPSTDTLLFGSYDGTANFLLGSMDDMLLAQRAWSAAEVATIYTDSRTFHPQMLQRMSLVAKAPSVGVTIPKGFFKFFNRLPANDDRTYGRVVGE